MEQYIVDFLNQTKYWDITDWTLGNNNGNEPYAYSLNDGRQMIFISNYISLVDTWMDDPRQAANYQKSSKLKAVHKLLAGYFLQFGAPTYEQYPTRTTGTPGSVNKNT